MTLGDRLGRRLSRKAVLAILVLCVFGIVAIAITPKSYDLQVGNVPAKPFRLCIPKTAQRL